MAGDSQNGALDAKKGAEDLKNVSVLHINLVDLSGDKKPKDAQTAKAPKEFPLELAQAAPPAVGLNGRHTGPTAVNPYSAPGGGVAPGFRLPDGSQPQNNIGDSSGRPGTPSVTNWDDPAAKAAREKALNALANQNQGDVHKLAQTSAPTDAGHSADGAQVHHMGKLGVAFGTIPAAIYGQWGHPAVQRIAVPAQLKADARAEAGELPVLNKLINSPRKAYLEAFSPTYVAQSELKRILPIETAAKTHLVAVKTEAEENVEALQLKPKELTALKKVAAETPTTPGGIAEVERAQRQIDYLGRLKTAGISPRTALTDETKKIDFLTKNEKFLAGGTVAEKDAASLNWSGLTKGMNDLNVFSTADMKPVAEIAAKEEPFVSIAGKMMSRGELEAIARTTEAGKGFWGTSMSFGGKMVVSSTVVGAEAWAQSSLAQGIGDAHPDLARIIEPTVPGAFLKASALILSKDMKTRGLTYAGAQLYEAEGNMTHGERLLTMAAGLIPSAILLAKDNKALATTLAIADVGIGVAAELSDDFFYHNDKSISKTAEAVKAVTANPDDLSHSTLTSDVSKLKDAAVEDPFLLTKLYDAAHADDKAVKSNESVLAQKAKYKDQLITAQAQGETILNNGLTQSQYLKMQDRTVDIPDPPDHKEQYRIAHGQHIDIGGQGARTLIGAIGSANLLQWAASKQSGSDGDISSVEKQKDDMKSTLNDLFNKPHPNQIENAIKDSGWHFGSTVNDYDLTDFWKHNAFDYAHINTTIRDTANYWAAQLPTMQAKEAQAQQALDAAKANPASATDAAEKEHLYQARRDAAGLTQMWVGKLYRDEALMKIGQVQYLLEDSHAGHTVASQDIQAQLELVAVALANSKKYAPSNPDEAQLEKITVKMYQSMQLVPPTDFQPNH